MVITAGEIMKISGKVSKYDELWKFGISVTHVLVSAVEIRNVLDKQHIITN